MIQLRLVLEESNESEDFHIDRCGPADLPVAALLVCRGGIRAGIIEIKRLLRGIALVELVQELVQRDACGTTVAPHEETHSGIDRLLRLDRRFLRI